jgi:hypothetical protein
LRQRPPGYGKGKAENSEVPENTGEASSTSLADSKGEHMSVHRRGVAWLLRDVRGIVDMLRESAGGARVAADGDKSQTESWTVYAVKRKHLHGGEAEHAFFKSGRRTDVVGKHYEGDKLN